MPPTTSGQNINPTDQLPVAVIGAGVAGLCAAKNLLQEGLEVEIYEMGSQIGGMWCYMNDNGRSSAYRTLHINTAKSLTRFSDYPFDENIQTFPDHWEVHAYLEGYADHFDLRRRIRFNSEITSITPLIESSGDKPRWRVKTRDGQNKIYGTVIVATGHLYIPRHVDFNGTFTGEYLHSHDYKEPEPFVGKRICIVGVGNSAVDIASDVCVTSKKTVLVARSGVVIAPKLVFGIPLTDISEKLIHRWVPARLRQWVLKNLIRMVHGDMTDYGFKSVTKPVHPTSSASVVNDIAYQRISVKQGIDRIDGQTIHFVDESRETFDVLIAATGYVVELPFLPPEVVPVREGAIDLYKRMVPPEWPGLYLIGFIQPNTGLPRAFETQCQWLREFVTGRAILPTLEEMWADIEAKNEWVASTFHNSPRHTLEEDFLRYSDELRRDAREGRKRRKNWERLQPDHVQATREAVSPVR